ncbi:MAG: hypothetical protein AB7V50_09865, partial [Vampirovibrionia bacterium]
TIITKGGEIFIGTIKSMDTNSISITTDNGTQKLYTKEIKKIKFGVKEDYITSNNSNNVIDISQHRINRQSNEKNLNDFTKHQWHGMLINQHNQTINISIFKNSENIIVSLADKKFITRNFDITASNEISFFIMPEGKEKHKIQFKGVFGKYKISGNMINTNGETAYWTVYKDSVAYKV